MALSAVDRKFYQKMGVCPECRKETLFGDEKACLKCRAIKYAKCRQFRKEHPRYDADRRMIQYKERANNHQCTACGLQLDDDSKYKMCPKCLNRNRINLRRSRATRGV